MIGTSRCPRGQSAQAGLRLAGGPLCWSAGDLGALRAGPEAGVSLVAGCMAGQWCLRSLVFCFLLKRLGHTTRLASRGNCESHLLEVGVTGEKQAVRARASERRMLGDAWGPRETDGQGPSTLGPAPLALVCSDPGVGSAGPRDSVLWFPSSAEKVGPCFLAVTGLGDRPWGPGAGCEGVFCLRLGPAP